MNNIIFFGGKGGVGKTTCSSAFAKACAASGKKTLLVSTDPAHSTSDIFEKKIGDKIVNLEENIDAIEINADAESKLYMDRVRANLKNVVSPVIIKEIDRQIDAAAISPGTEEAALFDKMTEIILEQAEKYDKIVFDTAPTGHTVRLMSLPELLGAWLKLLIQKRRKALGLMQLSEYNGKKDKDAVEADPVVKILKKRLDNTEAVRKILIDEKKLSFIFVLNAEKLPIDETKKAIAVLQKYGIHVNNFIVNRILPENPSEEFWKHKKELEKTYLKEIDETFKGKNIVKLPLLQNDMKSNNIDDIAEYFKVFV